MLRAIISIGSLLIAALLAAQTTTQGTILVTGDKKVTVYGKPSNALNNVVFDNVNFCISIPDQGTSNPSVTITTNHLPSLNWIVPGTNPQIVDGRAYYTFIGNDNNSNATVSWAANADNPIVELTFVGGAGSPIVRLDDLSPGGGPSAQSYWYVQIIQAVTGDITNYSEMFYGAGAVNNGGAAPSYVPAQAPIVLPVELLGFEAKRWNEYDVQLTWETASEQQAAYFEIERKQHLADAWQSVGRISAVGNNIGLQQYGLLDLGVGVGGGSYYYRLKLVDEDGKMAYGPIRSVDFEGNATLAVFPNPATDEVTIFFGETAEATASVRLYSMGGKLLMEQRHVNSGDKLQLPNGLASGAHLVRVMVEDRAFFQQKLIIERP